MRDAARIEAFADEIDRSLSTLIGLAFAQHTLPSRSQLRGRQAQVLVVQHLGGGEAVVELDEIEVVRVDARLFVGGPGGVARQGVDVGEDLACLLVRVGGQHRRRDLDRPALLFE